MPESRNKQEIPVVYRPFGNRCSRCGGYFDEGGICPCGIDRDTGLPFGGIDKMPHYTSSSAEKQSTVDKKPAPQIPREHYRVGPTRCSCGGIIPEGEDICTNGGWIS